ncbi:MAG: S-layer homology domain-containing protein [Clostridia bacterium]|nr:S-layer homology domain-containing protein [Clostridia bacterium]
MTFIKKSKKMLSMLMALAFVLPLLPAAAFAAENEPSEQPDEEMLFISQTVASSNEVKFTLSEEDYAAATAEGASITWKLIRTGSFMNPGEDHEYIPLLDEEEPFPNELDEIDIANVPKAYKSYLNISNIAASFEDGEATLTFDVSPMISRQNPSVMHANGGVYTDVCGYFDLIMTVGDTDIVAHSNVVIRPYESFHSMWEVYDLLAELADMGDNSADTAVPYVSLRSMGQSTAGYEMPYLIVAKDSAAVENWLELCEMAETQPEALKAKIESGEVDFQIPVMYSNIHSNETAAVDGILNLAKLLVTEENIGYDTLTALTEAGQVKLDEQREAMGLHTSELIEPNFLGAILPDDSLSSQRSGKVEGFDEYYEQESLTVNVDAMLDEIFFILVPEENVEGRINITRASSNGYDLNRDNSFQTTPETQNMQHLIATYNPATLLELHGQVVTFQVEPCSPPHEPNFEYDLLSNYLLAGGEAFGAAAVANNDLYQSYAVPMRDYLYSDDEGNAFWSAPWDDMSTSYTPQFAMMQGTVAYTVELPAYSEATTNAATYGLLGLSDFIAENKEGYFLNQIEIYDRCLNNENTDDLVGPWLVDAYDNVGAEQDVFRPAYNGEGQNGQFFPEAYIIPLDGKNQSNLDAAYDMIEWLTRNDVKVGITDEKFTYDGVTYPSGTMVVSMYQAKRAVANGVLYNGTVIRNWTELYSEGITAFGHTRGFSMITVAEPAAYEVIAEAVGETLVYESGLDYIGSNAKTYFSGIAGYDAVIHNSSEDAVAAVNALLYAGKKVGFITEGEYKGDFICSYTDYKGIKDEFVFTATGVKDLEAEAFVLEPSKVYINGTSTALSGASTGAVRVPIIANSSSWNYDMYALELMGFKTTNDAGEADVVIGATGLDAQGLAAVQAGTPYIGYSSSAGSNVKKNLIPVGRASTAGMDCLGYVTYPNETMVNASYIAEGDEIMYGYGTYYFTDLPEGAVVLVQGNAEKYPLEGFLNGSEESLNAFLGGIKGFAYEGPDMNGNQIDIALFANTLTNKAHQRDEYAFISNFIFDNAMTEEVYEATVKNIVDNDDDEPSEPEHKCLLEQFDDADADAWYHETLEKAVELGLIKGTSEDTVEPNGTMTRAMLVTVLHRLEGEPEAEGEMPFADCAEDTWYSEAVIWAHENGIIKGVSETEFAPNDNVTREQLAVILHRYAKSEGVDVSSGEDTNILSYEDAFSISGWAFEALQWACAEDIVNGSDGSLLPQNSATRAEASAMLVRYLAAVK